jgi:hypothetical protein
LFEWFCVGKGVGYYAAICRRVEEKAKVQK